jgi:large subunit ribosomal protein L20
MTVWIGEIMPRVKGGPKTRARRKKWIKAAKGYWGARSKLFKSAKQAVMKSLAYAYRDRRRKKRDMRRLHIIKINAFCRQNGLTYGQFINGLKRQGIAINRKMLASLAVENPSAFADIIKKVKEGSTIKQTNS